MGLFAPCFTIPNSAFDMLFVYWNYQWLLGTIGRLWTVFTSSQTGLLYSSSSVPVIIALTRQCSVRRTSVFLGRGYNNREYFFCRINKLQFSIKIRMVITSKNQVSYSRQIFHERKQKFHNLPEISQQDDRIIFLPNFVGTNVSSN